MKSVTMLTGILVTCMILISSIVPKPYNPDDMFQVIDPDKLKDINPDLLIVQADSQELLDNKLKNNPVWSSLKAVQNNKVIYADYSTYMLGFGIVSQEAIMKQISDEWGLN